MIRFNNVDRRPRGIPLKRAYNPRYCRTCQILKIKRPRLARTRYSDCEEHYWERVLLLSQTNVELIRR